MRYAHTNIITPQKPFQTSLGNMLKTRQRHPITPDVGIRRHIMTIGPVSHADPASKYTFLLETTLWWNIGCTMATYRSTVNTSSAYDDAVNKAHNGRSLSHSLQNRSPEMPDRSLTDVRVVVDRMTSSDAMKSMQL